MRMPIRPTPRSDAVWDQPGPIEDALYAVSQRLEQELGGARELLNEARYLCEAKPYSQEKWDAFMDRLNKFLGQDAGPVLERDRRRDFKSSDDNASGPELLQGLIAVTAGPSAAAITEPTASLLFKLQLRCGYIINNYGNAKQEAEEMDRLINEWRAKYWHTK